MIRLLARGGMGSVYEARQTGAEGFEKTIAIKTIIESFSQDPEFVRMFVGEAKLVADLVHQNIVQVYQLGQAASRPRLPVKDMYYIAMEYVDGANVEDYLDEHWRLKRELPIELGAFIVSRVCRGLEYAHDKRGSDGHLLNIVHRDVSPRNIMMTFERVVKLTDFGIAKARHLMEQREGEVLIGKAEYMSPEQADYEPTDRRSDIFSLGIVMFEILTGMHIFAVKDTEETLHNVRFKPVPDPREYQPDISPELARICLKALERDVEKRYQDAGTMGYEIESYMYSDRFGPTNVTLGRYLRGLLGVSESSGRPEADDVIKRRADTMHEDLM